MGGDEFIIVFRKNESQSENMWKEMKNQLDNLNQQKIVPYNMMASHGLFYYCTGMVVDIDLMIEEADKKMYKEKQKYKQAY
jgi:GGDEF domain-containing protein